MDQPPAIVEVLGDYGGTLGSRVVVTDWLRQNGIRVEIIGACVSACGWLLTLPPEQVCVAPGAWIGYPKSFGPERIEWQRGRDLIARGYRECGR